MTGMPRRPRRPDQWSSPHERARSRAAERLDSALDPGEAAWLDGHLATCPDCRAAAAAYDADRADLRALRDVPIQPPRDLWARTAAGIEVEARRRGRRPRHTAPVGGSRFPLGALTGVMVVVLVVGAAVVSGGWLDQPRVPAGSTPAVAAASTAAGGASGVPQATPINVTAGNVTWIHSLSDGGYAYNSSSVNQVCPVGDQPGCASLAEGPPEKISLDSTPRTIIGSPTDDQAVVVGPDGSGSDKVFVVALPEPPKRTAEPSKSPAPTPETATPTPTATVASASPAGPSTSPSGSAGASASPTASAGTESASPPASPAVPSATPDATPTATPPTETPTPIPSPTLPASPQATASAIAIASGVTVVGQSAAFSADGRWFAFTARPSDGSAGPDIYVWQLGEGKAKRVTDDGGSVFASWAGDLVVGSRVAAEAPMPAITSPRASSWTRRPAPRPATRSRCGGPSSIRPPATPWPGTARSGPAMPVRRSTPARGQLVITSWRPDAAAVATRSQVPTADDTIGDLDVRWDETGGWVAIWTADASDPGIGRLSLYRLDTGSGTLVRPKGAPRDVPALPGFSIGDGRLAWVTPHGQDAEGSKVQVVAWSGDGVGAVESVPADDVVVVR